MVWVQDHRTRKRQDHCSVLRKVRRGVWLRRILHAELYSSGNQLVICDGLFLRSPWAGRDQMSRHHHVLSPTGVDEKGLEAGEAAVTEGNDRVWG